MWFRPPGESFPDYRYVKVLNEHDQEINELMYGLGDNVVTLTYGGEHWWSRKWEVEALEIEFEFYAESAPWGDVEVMTTFRPVNVKEITDMRAPARYMRWFMERVRNIREVWGYQK